MKINNIDAANSSGFYVVNFDTFTDVVTESEIEGRFDLGGVSIYHGRRFGSSIWLLDNPIGQLYGIWVEADATNLR